MNPKITVFTSSYNHAKYLKQAIESVLQQTYANFEYMLFDDCSDDNSFEVTVIFDIIGEDFPTQQFTFLLEATR